MFSHPYIKKLNRLVICIYGVFIQARSFNTQIKFVSNEANAGFIINITKAVIPSDMGDEHDTVKNAPHCKPHIVCELPRERFINRCNYFVILLKNQRFLSKPAI